jgi:hypothetical protein
VNTLAFNPPGSEEGFLFWASWLNHTTANVFSTQDAHGPVRRGLVIIGCSQLNLLNNAVRPNNPTIDALTELVNFPEEREICPGNPVAPTPEETPPAQASAAAVASLPDELEPMPTDVGLAPLPQGLEVSPDPQALEPSLQELEATMDEGS